MSTIIDRRLATLRAIGLLVWTLGLLPPCLIAMALFGRAPKAMVRRWNRGCCRLLGLEVEATGQRPAPHPTLFVANHVSYLDIFVLGALLDTAFIAKSEVAGWPGIALIARIGRTVFIDRRARSSRRQRDAVSRRLAGGDNLVLFAEGTSSNGSRVLPFKSTLFSALETEHLARRVAIQPVTIDYAGFRGGLAIGHNQRAFYGWYGDMTLLPHLWQVLGLPGSRVRLSAALPVRPAASRKALALQAERAVAEGLRALRAA